MQRYSKCVKTNFEIIQNCVNLHPQNHRQSYGVTVAQQILVLFV